MFKANCGSPDSHITQRAVPRSSFPHLDQKMFCGCCLTVQQEQSCKIEELMLQVESTVCLLAQKYSGFAKLDWKHGQPPAFPTNPAWNITALSGGLLELYYLCFHTGYLNVAINKTKMLAVCYQTFYWWISSWTKAPGKGKDWAVSELKAHTVQSCFQRVLYPGP